MKHLILMRDYRNEATLGALFLKESDVPLMRTLERRENDNKQDDPKTAANDSGCIPEGTYRVVWSKSKRFGKETFEILSVPGRSGIRIHGANMVDQLEGCIAPATNIQDMNPKRDTKILPERRWWGSQSQDALKKLIEIVGEPKEFMLTITAHV